MKRSSVGVFASVVALALVGCRTTAPEDIPPVASPVTIAKQACEINALAEEREAVITSLSADDPSIPPGMTDRRKTILSEKLRRYSAEVEASYRFVTAACNSYNLCMENNGYNEQACDQSRKAWVASHEKFNDLTARLASIRRGGYYGRHSGGPYGKCTTQGGVFSAGCDDGD